MDDIHRIRQQRLQNILAEEFPGRGGQALLAQALERQSGYISRCLRGEKTIGEKFARYVEEKLHLPRFWLDSERNVANRVLDPEHVELLENFEALTPSQQRSLFVNIAEMRRQNDEVFLHMVRRKGGRKTD